MSALLDRHNRLSEAQKARFIGYLLGGDVPPEVMRQVGKALTYAEGINPGGDLFDRAMEEAIRLVQQDGLSIKEAEARIAEQTPYLASPPVTTQIQRELERREPPHKAIGRIAAAARQSKGEGL